jgi:dolichol-phosphate mannosyltransferase
MVEIVVIVVPTYNEVEIIAETVVQLEKVFGALDASKYEPHILVYDSNSPDGTAAIVTKLKNQYNNLHLVVEKKKSGLGSAYAKAMQYAMDDLKADVIFEFDADGSHQPLYLKRMLKELDDGADVVIGSRYIKGGKIPAEWSIDRKFLSYVGNIISRLFLTYKYKDFTSGFRGTRTVFLRKIKLDRLLSKNYAYKLHLFWALHKLKAKIVEHPIEFMDRKKGYSKFPKNNIIESLKVVILLRFFELERYIKVCCVGLVGMAVQFSLFNIFRYLGAPSVLANLIGIEVAVICGFLLNNRFTFKEHTIKKGDGFLRYISKLAQYNLFSVGSMILQTLLLSIAIIIFGHGHLIENVAVFVGIILGSILNYFIYSRWLWRIK